MLCSTRNLFSWWNKELLTPRHEPRESPMLRAECWTTKLSGHPSTRSVCFIYLCLLFLVFWTKHLVLNGTKNEANKLLLQRLNELCLLLLSLTWEVWMAVVSLCVLHMHTMVSFICLFRRNPLFTPTTLNMNQWRDQWPNLTYIVWLLSKTFFKYLCC